jgi:adenine-specific DNA-methyltransferase
MFEQVGLPSSFFDGFLGTGIITAEVLKRKVKKIITVDNLCFNTIILKGFTAKRKNLNNISRHLDTLNALQGVNGYITENYASTYFTEQNCMKMDAVREAINRLYANRELNEDEYNYLLASFLLSADRIANTLGQYDAFLKHIGSSSFKQGRHVVDSRVYSPFLLRPLELLPACELVIYNENIFNCIDSIECDTAYFDPPYNTRQYCDNYHVLENLARWDKPALFGKTKKFERAMLKSRFSQRRQVKKAFQELFSQVRAKHVFVSYNSEGILGKDEVIELLSPYGTVKNWRIPYPVFGKGAGVSKKRHVWEYLFYVPKQ